MENAKALVLFDMAPALRRKDFISGKISYDILSLADFADYADNENLCNSCDLWEYYIPLFSTIKKNEDCKNN